MNGALFHYSGSHCDVGIDLGGLRFITPHCGMDNSLAVDLGFEHGTIAMSSATLTDLMMRGTEALMKQERLR